MPIASRLASIAAALLATPLLLEGLGELSFGLWETLIGLALVAGIAQQAVNSAAAFFTAETNAVNRGKRISRICGVCCTIALVSTVIFVPIALGSTGFLMRGLDVPGSFAPLIQSALPVIIFTSILQVQSLCYLGILDGLGYSGLAATVFGFGQASLYCFAAFLVLLGCGLYALPIAMGSSCAVTFIASSMALRAKAPCTCFHPVLAKSREFRIASQYAGFSMASNSIGVGRTVLDRIIIARADLGLAGSFGISQRLVSLVVAIFSVISAPLSAKITRVRSEASDAELIRIFRQISVVLAIGVGAVGCGLLLFRTPLLVLWFGKDHVAAHQFLLIGVFGAVSAITFAGPAVIVTKGIGRPDIETRYALASFLLLIVLKPIGLYFGGLMGGVLATSVSWGGAAIYMQRQANGVVADSSAVNRLQYMIYALVLIVGVLSWQAGKPTVWEEASPERLWLFAAFLLMPLAFCCLLLRRKRGVQTRKQGRSDQEGAELGVRKIAA